MSNSETIALKVLAKKNFKLSNPEFQEIHDAGIIEQHGLTPEDFEIFIHMSMDYEGTPPSSYRALNSIVMDYVDENKDDLEKMLSQKVVEHFSQEESPIDPAEFQKEYKDFIWEEQVDYMPMVDQEKKKIFFEIEVVVGIEPLEG